MLRNNVEVLSAKMADQKEDVEMSLELWRYLRHAHKQITPYVPSLPSSALDIFTI